MTKFTDIHGITFAPFAPAGSLSQDCARQSLRLMKERTNADFIILVPGGLQDTPQSENINYTKAVYWFCAVHRPARGAKTHCQLQERHVARAY